MSVIDPNYPPTRYDGDHGEVSATFRPTTTEPDLRTGNGGSFEYLATHATTGGDFGLYRVTMSADRSGTGTHFHRTMSESFFVLSGTLRLYDGRDWIDATAGDYLYVPPGGVHSFWNESGEEASFLMLFAPGAEREGYFEGLPDLAGMTDTERAEFFVRHDTFFADVTRGPAGDALTRSS